MPFLPFGEYLPDQPDFKVLNPTDAGSLGSATIKNCVPLTAHSYGPMPTFGNYSSNALTARCQGSYSLYDASGGVAIFAGDATKLYRIAAGAIAFSDVSRSSGGAYACPAITAGGFWSMTAFGTRVIAVNGADAAQTFLLGTDTVFSALAAAAPVGKYVAVIRDQVFIGNLSAQPYRVHWCANGDPTSWPTAGTAAAQSVLSDYQDLQQADLGRITGIVGGLGAADGAVFCERGIYSVRFQGGSTFYAFPVAQGVAGTRAPMSIVLRRLRSSAGVYSVAYYWSENGVEAFDGASSTPIGADKFDRTLYSDLDEAYLPLVQGVADPSRKLIFWAYMGPGSGGLYNRLLVYNWDLGRAALCELTANYEWFTRSILGTGKTLEQLDTYGTIDTLPASLDDPQWAGGALTTSAFGTDHKLNTLTGPAMGAVLETAEMQPYPGRRARALNARPIIDSAAGLVSVGVRERLVDPVVYHAEVPINVLGDCPQRCSGRYVRYRLRLPAGQSFTHLQGLDVEMIPDSARR